MKKSLQDASLASLGLVDSILIGFSQCNRLRARFDVHHLLATKSSGWRLEFFGQSPFWRPNFSANFQGCSQLSSWDLIVWFYVLCLCSQCFILSLFINFMFTIKGVVVVIFIAIVINQRLTMTTTITTTTTTDNDSD